MRSFSLYFLEILSGSGNKIALALILFFVLPTVALGASLSFYPSGGSYEAGAVFTVGIYVNSGEEAINAVSGVVSYPEDMLEVVSLSKNQSIISLWVQEPHFSNTAGTINFEGIVLNPGFNGSNGRILDVTFKSKSEGSPTLSFVTGSVLANDGEGSEILSSKDEAEYSVAPFEASALPILEEAIPIIDEESANLLPLVSSETNPQDGWSSQATGTFNFSFSDNVTSLRLLLDKKTDSIPTVVYTPPILSREISDLEEGVSYLHVQYRDDQGWGEILHHKIQIDTKPPESFVIREIVPGTFLFEAKDSSSGIVRYEIQIDGAEVVEFIDDGSHLYKMPEQSAGPHTLFVKAFDEADNFITATLLFEVPPKALEVPAPQEQNQVLTTNGFLVPEGAIFITILSIIIPSLALILVLCALLYVAWRSAGGLRRRIDKEVREANMIVQKSFMILKTDLQSDIETLKKASKKRKLTRVETKILKRLQNNLGEAEKAIIKEVADIEKEL